jgi:hypothetical protein
MLIPGSLYGSYADVKRRCTKALRTVGKGTRWTEAFLTDGMLDVSKTPGVVMLYGPTPLVTGRNFHVYLCPRVTQDALFGGVVPNEQEDEIFADCLTTSWGAVSLLSANQTLVAPLARYVNPTARERPMVEASVRYWREWTALGARFTGITTIPDRIAVHAYGLRADLIKLGVPRERLVDHVLDDFLELAAEVGVGVEEAR